MDAQYTGNQIATLRKAMGLTQRQLAEQLHVTDKAVSKWERGINFPDLGLLENLASVLKATPARLLGLENADQAETVTTLAEISDEQLADAKNDLRLFSWGAVAAALLLALAYHLAQRRAVEVYYLLTGMIALTGIPGLLYLYQYGEIKKWEPAELGTFLGTLLPVLIWQGSMFVTGSSLSLWIVWPLIGISCTFAQVHFIQVMRPRLMQLLPLILSALYALWQGIFGGITFPDLIPLLCCLVVFLLNWRKNPGKWKFDGRVLGIWICLVLLAAFLLGILCYSNLVRTYVTANQDRLERYALEILASGNGDSYGFWEVTPYPELGIVQFQTGGSGLAPGSIYEGFYYSASDAHIPFPGFDFEMDSSGTEAWFRDLAEYSDNWQKSTRIAPNWFWFELHY